MLGASGGVGLTAVEVGKALGATVIACASSAEKLEVARSRGADHLIDYAKEDIRERVKQLTGGVDVVYDPVGGDASRAALRCLNFEGRLITLGFASGEIPQIAANYLLVKNISAIGYSFSSYRFEQPAVMRRTLEEICRWYAEGKLKPHISFTFPLDRTKDALNALLARKSTGKVIIDDALDARQRSARARRSAAASSVSGARAKQSRRKPSPSGPKAVPGARPTPASCTSRLAKSRLFAMPSTAKKA